MQKVIRGILTNYEVVGKGPDLVILPGWKGSLEEWRGIAGELGKKYKVYSVDLPGFGGTSRPDGDWGIYDYADWTEEFIKKMGIKNPIIIGYSFGGRLAIILAARGRAKRLVLVDTAGMETRGVKSKMLESLIFLKGVVPLGVRERLRSEDYRQAGKMRGVYKRVVQEDLRKRLETVKCPTLIIWGEKDNVLPFTEARMLHGGIKGSVLRVVWGATHWPHLEKPDDLVRILGEEGI
ncbi:MAG: hydrolase [Microgenomates group bacterium Gr01-1014_16]|nr:MAG: hydrolase [Microgenomates group bacterium Gr01-1014_16]